MQELLSLLLIARTAGEGLRIERTFRSCAQCDARWWEAIGDAQTAEELIDYFNKPLPRILPPLPYEEMP